MKIFRFSIITILLTIFFVGCTNTKMEFKDNEVVVFETSKGNFEVEIFYSKTPITSGNFLDLVQKNFYDGQRFHRIIENFMIQGGDPNSKDLEKKNLWGTGGSGYKN